MTQPAPASSSALRSCLAQRSDDLYRAAEALVRGRSAGGASEASDLAHDCALKLLRPTQPVALRDDVHVRALFRLTLRQAAVDASRRSAAGKRRLPSAAVDAEQAAAPSGADPVEVDDLITRLEEVAPRHGRLVTLHVFDGHTLAECAGLLSVSRRTVSRMWTRARGWLRTECAA